MAMARQEDGTVMLSTFAPLSVNSAKHLDAHADRPFAAAQGDMGTLSCCGSELALNEVNGVTR